MRTAGLSRPPDSKFKAAAAPAQIVFHGGEALQEHIFRPLFGIDAGNTLRFLLGKGKIALPYPFVEIHALFEL